MLRMQLGDIPPTLLVVRTLFFLLLSYSLDQPTNYSHFFLLAVSTVGGRRGVGEREGNGGCLRLGVSSFVLFSS